MFIVLIAALFTVAAAIPVSPEAPRPIQILKQTFEQDASGKYSQSYETENGIISQEQGEQRIAAGAQEGGEAVQGYYSYVGPDGVQYAYSYTADENGFRVEGSHLPTPPPVPQELVDAFANAPKDEGLYDERGFLIDNKKLIAVRS